MKKIFTVLMSFMSLLCVSTPFAFGGQLNNNIESLPYELNLKEFMNWLVPNQKGDHLKVLQVRKWKDNKYVIMACIEENISASNISESLKGECGNGSFDVYVGVISLDGQKYNFTFRTYSPVSMDANDDYESYSLMLDLAPYHVSENTTSIGLRKSSSSTWTGGHIGSELLWLLMPHGEQLHEIFKLETDSYDIIPGELNSDGSRNRDGQVDKSTLHVLKTKTNGYYDYLVKTVQYRYEGKVMKKSTINTRYVWSGAKKQYVPK